VEVVAPPVVAGVVALLRVDLRREDLTPDDRDAQLDALGDVGWKMAGAKRIERA